MFATRSEIFSKEEIKEEHRSLIYNTKKLRLSPSNPQLKFSQYLPSKTKTDLHGQESIIIYQDSQKIGALNKPCSVAVENLLYMYVQQNKKLAKERIALFQKNCQLINEINTIKSPAVNQFGQGPNEKKSDYRKNKQRWNKMQADEKQFSVDRSPQFRVSQKNYDKTCENLPSPITIFHKQKNPQLFSTKFLPSKQKIDLSNSYLQKKQKKLVEAELQKFQNQKTIPTIYNPLGDGNSKSNRRVTTYRPVQNQQQNKNENSYFTNKTMNKRRQQKAEQTPNRSVIKNKYSKNAFENLDAKIKKLKDQNKKLRKENCY